MVWSDFFKLFTYAFTKDPLGKKVDTKELIGVAYSQPESIPQAGMEGSWSGSAGDQKLIRYRETNDFIDLSTVTNRISRYKEYERLRNVPEIEMAMTVISDEACISGDTPIALPHGFISIKELAETKDPKERFLVYCWDFEKHDYTLGWAFHPRKVKRAETIKLILNDGTALVVTPDHEILDKNGEWKAAEDYKFGEELMPFYRESPYKWSELKTGQFPRIYTHKHGWIHERHFVDEWRFGKLEEKQYKVFKAMKMFSSGSCMADVVHRMGGDVRCWKSWIQQEGFTQKELKILGLRKKKTRRIVGIHPWEEIDVYDMSVEKHKCFCTDSVIVHNCQKDDDGDVVKIECENEEILEECNFVLKHRDMININARAWTLFKSLCIHGDLFLEIVINPENPKEGVYKAAALPPDSIYRIETTKGKVVEYQQSNEGPDYEALSRAPVTQQNDAELRQATALRFTPEQMIHMKFGDDRKTFYPYGQSLIEPARGPAHQTRLMEESMIVYRLTRAPERRVFYIDVGQLPPFKAEAYIDRLKDQFRKKKTTGRSGLGGAHQVEERWQAPAADEDIWVPIRPNANTRIETLPGASNLGEIDDAVYFRNKLFTALNFPKNYFSNEDPNTTRITLSAQDVKFARMIERLQSQFEGGLWEILNRHLILRGYPPETYQDLKVSMTPPSDWRELSRAEVWGNRLNWAGTLKSSQLMADWDLYVKILKYPEVEADEMISRLKLQKIEDLKLQIIAQNPRLLGIGIPGQDAQPGQELGTEAGGPTPNPAPEGQLEQPEQPKEPPAEEKTTDQAGKPSGLALPDPEDEDIAKYDLEIQGYASEIDYEEPDYSIGFE